MSGNDDHDEAQVAPASPGIDAFIEKENAEVYLLLDYLSGRADKSISDEKISITAAGIVAGAAPSIVEKSLIDAVCEVRWPPAQGVDRKTLVENASILLKARDRLSTIASPASGASIAFTTCVTNEMSNELSPKVNGRGPPPPAAPMLSNAQIAYPSYQRLASSFNLRRKLVGAALPVSLFLAIMTTSLVAYYHNLCPKGGSCHPDLTPLVGTVQDQALPILYGVVGALTGVLRGIQIKVRDGLLMPRDRIYIVMQLWLGVVMGATIGLFPVKSGSLSLAPSALSFIAGLGVDSVFLWLESLIKTIFGNKQAGSNGQ